MPFIRGRYYMNPAYGRAIEIARDSDLSSQLAMSNQHPGDARWVTINGRHVLIQEGEAGHASESPSERIVGTAKKYDGSTDWAFATRKDNFAANTNKCNKFV